MNDIRTGNLPASLISSSSQKNSRTVEQSSNPASGQTKVTDDTVSMTAKVGRLQEIEGLLAAIPVVNDTLVAEISQAIADGSIEINLDRIASNLIEMETGVLDSQK